MTEVARAREVLALMRAGALDGLSIGFRTVKGRRDAATGIRRSRDRSLGDLDRDLPDAARARVAAVKTRAVRRTRCRRNANSNAGSRGMLG